MPVTTTSLSTENLGHNPAKLSILGTLGCQWERFKHVLASPAEIKGTGMLHSGWIVPSTEISAFTFQPPPLNSLKHTLIPDELAFSWQTPSSGTVNLESCLHRCCSLTCIHQNSNRTVAHFPIENSTLSRMARNSRPLIANSKTRKKGEDWTQQHMSTREKQACLVNRIAFRAERIGV